MLRYDAAYVVGYQGLSKDAIFSVQYNLARWSLLQLQFRETRRFPKTSMDGKKQATLNIKVLTPKLFTSGSNRSSDLRLLAQ